MTLILHKGAEAVDYDGLRSLTTPDATETHVPIPHHSVVDLVKYSLGYFGHSVVQEDYGVTPDGMRFFGVLTLESEYGSYRDTVGLRNSHDRKFPVGISFGSVVTVCDNLAFYGSERVVTRKHTKRAKHMLPSIVAEVVEPLREQRLIQARTFETYQHTQLTPSQVRDGIMQLYERDVISVTKIADVHEAFRNPQYDWGGETAWRLFNATTFALTGKVMENPAATQPLYEVIDGFCTERDPDQLLLLPN